MRKDHDGVSSITKLGFIHNDAFYDVSLAKSKQYYNLLIQQKATLPNAAKMLKIYKFNIEYEDLSEVYLLPIKVCIELRRLHRVLTARSPMMQALVMCAC